MSSLAHLSVRIALLTLGASPSVLAQAWNEVGDAGSFPHNAQIASGLGPVQMLTGTLTDAADLYLIDVRDVATFEAVVVAGGLTDPTMLMFDEQGRGVVAADDNGVSLLPRITGASLPAPGRYYLAISALGNLPRNAKGPIWDSFVGPEVPNGDGRHEPITDWLVPGSMGGTYFLTLQGTGFVAERAIVPAGHAQSSSPTQVHQAGSTVHFAPTPTRFQMMYRGLEFAAAGIQGPITIHRLQFRAEDGERNGDLGIWPNATVRLSRTSRQADLMSDQFAINQAAPTILGQQFTTTVRMQRARGGMPNDYVVSIDLGAAGAAFQFDPSGLEPNLLVDVTLPSWNGTVSGAPSVAMQDVDVPTYIGNGIVGAAGAAQGTFTAPLVMAIEYTGGTGANRAPVVARTESIGAASGGSPSSFYQAFPNGEAFDLTNMRLVPAGAGYHVQSQLASVDPTKVGATPLSIADDAVITAPLGFTLDYPGGSTSSIKVSTNGFVFLDANGAGTTSDFAPSVAKLLGTTQPSVARLAPFWYDFHCGRNVATHPNSGLHVFTDATGGPGNRVTWITWLDVGVFNQVGAAGMNVHTVQCVIHEATDAVDFRYGQMPRYCFNVNGVNDTLGALVGFSRGRIGGVNGTPSVDPRSRDLSLELPFTTAAEGALGNMGLRAVSSDSNGVAGARLFPGASVKWDVAGVPPGSLLGVQLIDFAATRPGLQLPTITAPGTMLSTTAAALLWEVDVLPTATQAGSVPLVVPTGADGAQIYAQYVVLGGLFGAPDLITVASNALQHTVGRR